MGLCILGPSFKTVGSIKIFLQNCEVNKNVSSKTVGWISFLQNASFKIYHYSKISTLINYSLFCNFYVLTNQWIIKRSESRQSTWCIISAFEISKKGLHTPCLSQGLNLLQQYFISDSRILILYFLLLKLRNQKGSFCQRGWTCYYPLAIRQWIPNSLKKRSRGIFNRRIDSFTYVT